MIARNKPPLRIRIRWNFVRVKLGMPIHPHMLRHSTGFNLANDGQDTRAILLYLGHRNIQHTVLYTQLATDRFSDFWKD
jgi:site-specific recombinase XerD